LNNLVDSPITTDCDNDIDPLRYRFASQTPCITSLLSEV
jgi:hypothetical protein